MAYQTTEPPTDPKSIPEYLSRELRRVEAELRRPSWINAELQNSWVTWGDTHAPAQYIKLPNGFVHLRGLIKNGDTTVGTTLFNLPQGYRPLYHFITNQMTSSLVVFRIDVRSNGDVQIIEGTPSSGWISLDGITFMAEQ